MTLPTSLRLKDGRWAKIRQAQPTDAGRWIENVNSVGAERAFLMTEVFARTVEEVQKQFANAKPDRELWLVAEVEEVLAGGADFKRGPQTKNAHVAALGMALRKEFRGVGLGTALMASGIEWARVTGLTRLRLSVFQSNERAIRLYQKFGFVEEGRLKGEVILDGQPTDEILMALAL